MAPPRPAGTEPVPEAPGAAPTPALAGTRSRIYYGWWVVAALGVLAVIVQGTSTYLYGISLVGLQRDLHTSRALVSGPFSLSFVVWGVAGILAGRVVDRNGPRLLMALGALIGAASLLLLAKSDNLVELYLLWGLGVGVSVGLTSQQLSYVVAAAWFDRRIGTAFGLLTTISALAPTIYLPAMGLIAARLGWRSAMAVGGLLYLVIALPAVAGVLRRGPAALGLDVDGRAPRTNQAKVQAEGLTLRAAVRRLAFWTIALNASFTLLSWGAVSAHQIAFLIERRIDPVVATSALGLVGVISIPARLVINALSDRYGPKTVLSLTTAVQTLGTLLLLLTVNIYLLGAYVLIFGLAFGAASGLRAAMLAAHVGRRSFGTITAVIALVSVGPSALGPLAAGWLFDRFGNYDLAFLLATVLMAMSTLMVVLTPEAPERKS